MSELNANGDFVLFEETFPEMDDAKSALLLNPGDLNPTLMYGKVLSSGDLCELDYDGDFIYVIKMNAIKITHLNKDYYAVREHDIISYID